MEQNVGNVDSYVRFLVGSALWVNIFALEAGALGGLVLFLLGALMFFTADKHHCFVYNILGISTVTEVRQPSAAEEAHH